MRFYEVCFYLRFGSVLERAVSAAKKSRSVEKRSVLAKLCIPLCLFCLLPGKIIVFVLIFNELTVKHIQWSGKLRYSVEWLNILGSTSVLNLFLASEHLNSSKDEPVLIFNKMSWRKIKALARINFLSRIIQPMFAIQRQGKKKKTFFIEHLTMAAYSVTSFNQYPSLFERFTTRIRNLENTLICML